MCKGIKNVIFIFLITSALPISNLFAQEIPLNPEYCLKRAAAEINKDIQPENYSEFSLIVKLAREIARFDKQTSNKLFDEAFNIAKSTKGEFDRFVRIELFALYISALDKNLSTQALKLLQIPEGYKKNPASQLKNMAIEFVLAHRNNLQTKNEILLNVEKFCNEYKVIYEYDRGSEARTSFAEYVSILEPELSKEILTRLCPEQATACRTKSIEYVLPFLPEFSKTELSDILSNKLTEADKYKASIDLYYAGDKEKALSIIAEMKLSGAGGGSPLGDMISNIAISDPNEAEKIVNTIGVGKEILLYAILENRPEDITVFIQKFQLNNKIQINDLLSLSARTAAQKGEIEFAKKLLKKAEGGGENNLANSAIAEASNDLQLMTSTLQSSLNDRANLKPITGSAVRLLGVKQTEEILAQTLPGISDRDFRLNILCALDAVSDYDPAWAFDTFKNMNIDANLINYSHNPGGAYYNMLQNFASVDPNLTEKLLREYGKKLHPQTFDTLKTYCAEGVARRSVPEAKQFAEKFGLNAGENSIIETRSILSYRVNQIIMSPDKAQQILDGFNIKNPSEKVNIIYFTAMRMTNRENYYYRDLDGIVELADALEDKSLADEALSISAQEMYSINRVKTLVLLDKIHSPYRLAHNLFGYAVRQLYPVPMRDTPFLAGLKSDNLMNFGRM